MDLHKDIRQFIVSNFYVPEPAMLRDADSLLDTGVVDSTGVLELITHLESTYGITVQDEEVIPANLDSVTNLVAFVERKLASDRRAAG